MKTVNGIPALGFGTYGRRGDDGIAALKHALDVGYRHLDTAQSYNTEAECGEAIRASGLPREEIWVTTKIDMPNFAAGKLIPSLEISLETIGVGPVDLTLIHWPSPNAEIELHVYLEQLAEAHSQGLTRNIGVSNFPIALMKAAHEILGGAPILTNQFELHPYLTNEKLARYCQDEGVAVTAYQPLAHGKVAEDKVLQDIAAAHEATAAQVVLAWQIAKGHVAIPTSSNHDRIAENFGALNVTLTAAEIASIDELNRNERRIDPSWGPDWD